MPKNKEYTALYKNTALLEWLTCIQDETFTKLIRELRVKLGFPEDMPWEQKWTDILNNESFEQAYKYELLARNTSLHFLKKIKDSTEKKRILSRGINKIIKKNNLGGEWFEIILDIVVRGFYKPPEHNLEMRIDKKRKIVDIRINASTSLADIQEAWGDVIKLAQKEVLGKSRRPYITEDFFDKLYKYEKYKKTKDEDEAYDAVEDKHYKLTAEDKLDLALGEELDELSEEDRNKAVKQLRNLEYYIEKSKE